MWERRQASVPVWSAVPLRKVHSIIAKFFLCITLSPPSTWTNVLNLQVHPSISVDSALILKGLQYKTSAWQPLSQACISNIWHLGSVTSDYQSVLKVKNACRGTKNNISSLTRVCVCVCARARAQSLSHVRLFVTSQTIAHQPPLPMGFCQQEHRRGLSFTTPGDLPDPGIKLASLASPALVGRFFTTEPPGNHFGL